MKDNLLDVIKKYKDKHFIVIRPGGHYGDILIYLGLEKMLWKMNLDFSLYEYKDRYNKFHHFYIKAIRKVNKLYNKIVVDHKDLLYHNFTFSIFNYYLPILKVKFYKDHVILIHGGGNVNDLWGNGLRLLYMIIYHNPYSTIIIAPQSYYFKYTNIKSLIGSFKGKLYLFCRERYSYLYLQKMNLPKNIKVFLAHDTALYLTKHDFNIHTNSKYDLICFREDKESVVPRFVKDMIIKFAWNPVVYDISIKAKSFSQFLKFVANANVIYTDRLHVAILGYIFSKKVFLFPNKYWKIKGVYEYSLSKCQNIFFIDKYFLSKKGIIYLFNKKFTRSK